MHEHQLFFTLFAWEICCLAVPKLYFVWTPYLCCVRNTSQFSAAGAWLEMWKWALHMWPWTGCCTCPWPAGAHSPGVPFPPLLVVVPGVSAAAPGLGYLHGRRAPVLAFRAWTQSEGTLGSLSLPQSCRSCWALWAQCFIPQLWNM